MEKILLINPRPECWRNKTKKANFPLGLLHLATFFSESADVKFVDCLVEEDYKEQIANWVQ